jgi:tetratricopeptide (TPR) repeat protein
MAQPATNPKIEELRFRIKSDPKSRLFYQLAEELRRAGQFAESEQLLRQGLVHHPTYLAAWVSLGRVLREQQNDAAAVEALNTALQLDPGNVVAARLLGDAYLVLGERVEAIKKYKLVHAILPTDEDLRATIERLETELHPPQVSAFDESEADAFGSEDASSIANQEADSAPLASQDEPPVASAQEASWQDVPSLSWTDEPPATFPENPAPQVVAAGEPLPWSDAVPVAEESPGDSSSPDTVSPFAMRDAFSEDSPFDKTTPPFRMDDATASDAGDDEPMASAHESSPFEDPAPSALADALAIESPVGIHVDFAPESAEVAAPVESLYAEDGFDESEVFAAAPSTSMAAGSQDVTDTLTMADLYSRQGLTDDARTIYEHILARDPGNEQVREKLFALTGAPAGEASASARVARLERWLAKVSRREVGRV